MIRLSNLIVDILGPQNNYTRIGARDEQVMGLVAGLTKVKNTLWQKSGTRAQLNVYWKRPPFRSLQAAAAEWLGDGTEVQEISDRSILLETPTGYLVSVTHNAKGGIDTVAGKAALERATRLYQDKEDYWFRPLYVEGPPKDIQSIVAWARANGKAVYGFNEGRFFEDRIVKFKTTGVAQGIFSIVYIMPSAKHLVSQQVFFRADRVPSGKVLPYATPCLVSPNNHEYLHNQSSKGFTEVEQKEKFKNKIAREYPSGTTKRMLSGAREGQERDNELALDHIARILMEQYINEINPINGDTKIQSKYPLMGKPPTAIEETSFDKTERILFEACRLQRQYNADSEVTLPIFLDAPSKTLGLIAQSEHGMQRIQNPLETLQIAYGQIMEGRDLCGRDYRYRGIWAEQVGMPKNLDFLNDDFPADDRRNRVIQNAAIKDMVKSWNAYCQQAGVGNDRQARLALIKTLNMQHKTIDPEKKTIADMAFMAEQLDQRNMPREFMRQSYGLLTLSKNGWLNLLRVRFARTPRGLKDVFKPPMWHEQDLDKALKAVTPWGGSLPTPPAAPPGGGQTASPPSPAPGYNGPINEPTQRRAEPRINFDALKNWQPKVPEPYTPPEQKPPGSTSGPK